MSTGTANNRSIKAMSKKIFGGPHVPVPCWSGRGPPVLHHPLGVPRQSNQSSPPGLPRRHLGRLTDSFNCSPPATLAPARSHLVCAKFVNSSSRTSCLRGVEKCYGKWAGRRPRPIKIRLLKGQVC